jgi:hypothetical protein
MALSATQERSFGLPELPTRTTHHEWAARAIREHEEALRRQNVHADDRITILKPCGFEIFEEGATVYSHLRRAQTLSERAFAISEIATCLRGRIIRVEPAS